MRAEGKTLAFQSVRMCINLWLQGASIKMGKPQRKGRVNIDHTVSNTEIDCLALIALHDSEVKKETQWVCEASQDNEACSEVAWVTPGQINYTINNKKHKLVHSTQLQWQRLSRATELTQALACPSITVLVFIYGAQECLNFIVWTKVQQDFF